MKRAPGQRRRNAGRLGARVAAMLFASGAVFTVALVGTQALAGANATASAATTGRAGAPPASANFIAVDLAWTTNGNSNTNGSTVTIQAGQTVTFSYPSGSSAHNADFNDPNTNQPPAVPPICERTDMPDTGPEPPLPQDPQPAGWSGYCTFSTAGTYSFHCDLHPFMKGTIVVQAATTSSSTSSTSSGSTGTSSSSTTSMSTTSTTTTSASTTATTTSGGYGATTTTSTSSSAGRTSTSSSTSGKPTAAPRFGMIVVKGRQHGTEVKGRVRVFGSGLTLAATLQTKRSFLKPASRSSRSVTVGHLSKPDISPGVVPFTLHISSTPASASHGVPVTLTLTLTDASGRRVTSVEHVTVTPG